MISILSKGENSTILEAAYIICKHFQFGAAQNLVILLRDNVFVIMAQPQTFSQSSVISNLSMCMVSQSWQTWDCKVDIESKERK